MGWFEETTKHCKGGQKKGGFNLWHKNEKGEAKLVSKAFSDVNMARGWGVKVHNIFESEGKQKMEVIVKGTGEMQRGQASTYPVFRGGSKPQRSVSEEVTSAFRSYVEEMDVDVQQALMDAIVRKSGEEAVPDQPSKKICEYYHGIAGVLIIHTIMLFLM